MAQFSEKHETFIFRKSLEYWEKLVANCNDDCRDSDFFQIASCNFDHDRAVELISAAYTTEELNEMENAKTRSRRLVLWNNEKGRRKCRAVISAMIEYLRESSKVSANDIMASRFDCLKRSLQLTDLETEILTLAYIKYETNFEWPHRIETRHVPNYYAMALDRSIDEVRAAMSAQGRLMKFSLLDDDFDFSQRTLGGFMDGSSDEALSRRFYDKVTDEDTLPWEFFGDLAQHDGTILKRMLAADRHGCNILLYGAPGTGKTAFARSLAKELGRNMFQIAQGDMNGERMKPSSRMIGIQMCNIQEMSDTGLMLIDEADAILRSFELRLGGDDEWRTEKGVVNTLLDEMRMPAIWIANISPNEMDPSVRRRFDYSVRFDQLGLKQRAAVWRNQVTKHKLEKLIPSEKSEEFAGKYETSAGGISTVLANVKRMKPKPKEIDSLVETLMKPHCALMGLKSLGDFLPAKDYSLDGLSIKGAVTLDRLEKAAKNFLDGRFNASAEDRPRMNILLFGPPGTGKTEFVKYLGKALGRKVTALKCSDLLSCYVGETEHLIAQAFRRAKTDHSILFLDEIDSFLYDRSSASHSWEVTQVNELLQQMENFDGVMVAATNFSKNLDPATMRRFTFKLEFGYLEDDGKKLFFERFFKTSLSQDEFMALASLKNLAPGDFRTVRQELFYLGGEVNNRDRINALRDECSRKRDEKISRRIGFGC